MAQVTKALATDTTLNTGLIAVANAISHSMLQKDYTELDNKPQINGVTLEGNKTAADLSIDIAVATTAAAGKVKPDGTTITVDSDGTIHGANTVPICDNSDAWNSATNYTTVGQTVIDDNKVWECLQANQNKKPASNATYWKQVTLSSLNSSLMTKCRRTRRQITGTTNFANLLLAIAEQDLEKYGFSIGDYFVGNSGYKYHLADMDTYYGGYNEAGVVSTHHAGIVVDPLSTCAWLTSGTVSTYNASTLHSTLTGTILTNVKSDLNSLFGTTSDNHLVSYDMLNNTVGGWGSPTWVENTVICAMTEMQIYGSRVCCCDEYQIGVGNRQLELFRKFDFNEIFGNATIMLKSLYSNSSECIASNLGFSANANVNVVFRATGLLLLH